MSTQVDISQLAGNTERAPLPTLRAPNRWITRYLLPFVVVAAFVGVFVWSVWDSVVPAREVTIAPVVVARAEVQQAGTPLFQAAGWVEPQPAPTVVSSLAPGVVKEMLVVEGDDVTQGQTIATLIDTDANIALQQARADVAVREAEVEAAKQELAATQFAYDNPAALEVAVADAAVSLAIIEGEQTSLPSSFQSAKTQLELADQNVQRKQQAGQAVAGRLLRDAEGEFSVAQAKFKELESRVATLKTQRTALTSKRDALQKQLQAKVEETRNLAIATGKLKTATARLEQARLTVQSAALIVERMTIVAPISGRVLSVAATTGQRLSGINPHSEQGSSAVAALYVPQKLQVRVDVRLEDVRQVVLRQPVTIQTTACSEPLEGEVIAISSRADVQKNTLQVKVGIKDPPDVIRPEMLCQATFIAPTTTKSSEEESEDQLRVLIPRQLVVEDGASPYVWIADQETKQARKQTIALGRAGDKELVEVVSGINASDKLICGGREGLHENQRVRIVSEDKTMGMNGQSGSATVAKLDDKSTSR